MRESSFNPNAVSKAGAMGLAQVMPKTLASLEKKMGRKLNPLDPRDSLLIQRTLMKENMTRYHGNELAALSAYNGGTDPSRWGIPETSAYGPAIMGSAGMYASMMPSGAPGAASGRQSFDFNHTITLQDPKGNSIAAPSVVTKQVGPPQAAGVR
jgi:soluble lytic murein transglycosylase-like protein